MMKKYLSLLFAAVLLLAALGTGTIYASTFTAGDIRGGAPAGAAFAEDGSLLVCDTWNKVVWKVSGGSAALYAGAIGVPGVTGEPVGGYHDDASERAYFLEPWAVVPFADGFAVSDAGADVVRYIANGKVYTFSGSGREGTADGIASDASFRHPTGLASDGNGNLYIADTGNGLIRRADESGRVTTVVQGLESPMGLAWYDGALYIVETGRSRISRWKDGTLETVAGISEATETADEYVGGYTDGSVSRARFDHPQGIAVGADGTVYVADTGNGAVRAIIGDLVCTVACGSPDAFFPVSPRNVLIAEDTLYVSDRFVPEILTYPAPAGSYADVEEGEWFAEAADRMTLLGVVRGASDTEYAAGDAISRAAFVTALSRMHRLDEGFAIIDGDASFDDVSENEPFAAAVRWAADCAIVEGTGEGKFSPDDPLRREDLIVMLYNYARFMGYDVSATGDLSGFPDADSPDAYAGTALSWAVGAGILEGTTLENGTLMLDPQGTATRAQAAVFAERFLGKAVK